MHSLHALKTAMVYLAVSVFCVIFDKVYAIFGHGVKGASMTLMFLYPLLGGFAVFLSSWIFIPHSDEVSGYRFFYNSYNSGIAALTVGSMLNGIFEIAGTSSPYTVAFFILGWTFSAFGALEYLMNLRRKSSGGKA